VLAAQRGKTLFRTKRPVPRTRPELVSSSTSVTRGLLSPAGLAAATGTLACAGRSPRLARWRYPPFFGGPTAVGRTAAQCSPPPPSRPVLPGARLSAHGAGRGRGRRRCPHEGEEGRGVGYALRLAPQRPGSSALAAGEPGEDPASFRDARVPSAFTFLPVPPGLGWVRDRFAGPDERGARPRPGSRISLGRGRRRAAGRGRGDCFADRARARPPGNGESSSGGSSAPRRPEPILPLVDDGEPPGSRQRPPAPRPSPRIGSGAVLTGAPAAAGQEGAAREEGDGAGRFALPGPAALLRILPSPAARDESGTAGTAAPPLARWLSLVESPPVLANGGVENGARGGRGPRSAQRTCRE
jgi:hypothetical protein